MSQFINSKIESFHNKAIRNFSEVSRFLVSGSTKGYTAKEFSWNADLLFKQTGNKSLNVHTGFLDFVSDRDVMYQEYGNVKEIYERYQFFSERARNILSGNHIELSSKQYSKIGQRYSEFSLIDYVNESEVINHNDVEQPENSDDPFFIKHKYDRIPVSMQTGYLLDRELVAADYRNQFVFSTINISGLKDAEVSEGSFEYTLYDNSFSYEDEMPYASEAIMDDFAMAGGVPVRKLDYKLDVDGKMIYFGEEPEWVVYYNDSDHYEGDRYYPYYGHANLYEVPSSNDGKKSFIEMNTPGGGCRFFPEIIQGGVFEPAKITVNWSESSYVPKEGAASFNPSNHLGDPGDQSRIVYSICKHQLEQDDSNSELFRVIGKDSPAPSANIIYSGIDIDTERNRRYSSVVMTEPYMVTKPISGGQVVEYYFVDKDDKRVSFAGDANEMISNPDIFLRIKAPINVFTKIDEILAKQDFNTDIIHTISIEDPLSKIADFPESSKYYEDMMENLYDQAFYERQDNCLDDLIGGVIGESDSKHMDFYMDKSFLSDPSVYGDNISINGAGFVSKTVVDANGVITGTKQILNLYCSNYKAINTPLKDSSDPEAGVANESKEMLTNPVDNVTAILDNEKFKPMIKIPGINGYVKIMSRNKHFRKKRSSDGSFEMTFDVEFPYCPGSFSERVEFDFSEPVDEDTGVKVDSNRRGFVYEKVSYINAGSHKTYDGYYDSGNDRSVPLRDDMFTRHDVLVQEGNSGVIKTDRYSKGGRYSLSESPSNRQIVYPADVVWRKSDDSDVLEMSLINSKVEGYGKYGTYTLAVRDYLNDDYQNDLKLACLSDNRQWRFDEERYSSYIGRENPSLVFEMDVSALDKDFTLFQKQHGAVPDQKRWLSAYFSGFAQSYVVSTNKERQTDMVTTAGNFDGITTSESKSDFSIEIWDSLADIGDTEEGNWRPFTFNGFDSEKISGDLIVDNLFISGEATTSDDPVKVIESDDGVQVWRAYIGYHDSEVNDGKFPSYVNYAKAEDILQDQHNLVLYDKFANKAMHICKIEREADVTMLGREIYKVYFIKDDYVLKEHDTGSSPPDWVPEYQILNPKRMIGKDSGFDIGSIITANETPVGELERLIDLKSEDYDRYVSEGKVYFRIRFSKNREFPASFKNEDESELLYTGVGNDKNYESVPPPEGPKWINNPWSNSLGTVYDTAFDWSKVKYSEAARRIGLGYFRCSSK